MNWVHVNGVLLYRIIRSNRVGTNVQLRGHDPGNGNVWETRNRKRMLRDRTELKRIESIACGYRPSFGLAVTKMEKSRAMPAGNRVFVLMVSIAFSVIS